MLFALIYTNRNGHHYFKGAYRSLENAQKAMKQFVKDSLIWDGRFAEYDPMAAVLFQNLPDGGCMEVGMYEILRKD